VIRAWPVAPLLSGADVVVIAGGYQAVHEVRACGVPAVIVPQSRPWDDQEARAEAARAPHRIVARSPEELVDALRRLQGVPWHPEVLGDGAARLAALVERRVQAGVLGEEEVAPLA
jgi:UDP-N-acetylglucosamine:LPS N-acetylglucosamine transferase